MKYSTLILSILVFLAACGAPEVQDEAGIPEGLAEKKQLLKEKQDNLKALEKEIAELEGLINEQDPSAGPATTLVTAKTLARTDFKHYVEIQGSVQSDDFVGVSSEVGGRVVDLKVDEGQSVSKGQLIATLDLESLDKQIAELEKSLELAVEIHDRQKRLWDQNIGSEIQYLQAKNNKERLEKSLETLRFQSDKSSVYAPISGVVENVIVKAGEIAAPGMPIIQILNTNKVKVVAEVPENYLQSIRKGDMVNIQFPALDMEQNARVSLIGRTINPGNRTFTVEVNLNNSRGLLKPNLLALMLVNDYSENNVVVVPIELVQQEVGGKNYIYVTDKGEEGLTAKKVYVTPGMTYEGNMVIEEGLEGTEEIILDGARDLADKQLIEVKTI